MIDLAGIPVIPGNMVALREHAMMIAVAGTGYIDTGERVHNTWQRLRPHYVAPEAGQLLAATGPVATVCRHVGRNLQEARDVLVVYADTVETIQGELDALRTRATDVNSSIRDAGDDWRSDHDLVDRREAVADAITLQAVAFETAQRDCANGLRALHGQPALIVDNGDGQIDPAAEFGFTLDQYRDAYRADPDEGGGLPWGGHAERDYPWYVDVASAPLRFGQGIGDSVVGTAQGLGALIGYDHATGSWTGDTAGAAWTNLGKLVLAAGVYATPGGYLRDQAGAVPFLAPGEAGQLLTDTGKALIAWDQWDDDPARAAGHAVTNIALALVGTKGAGAGLRVGGAALQLTRHGSLTANAGAGLVRAGEAIGRIPTLTEVAGNAWRRLHPPDIPTAQTIIDDAGAAPRRPAPGQTVPGNLADDLTPRPPEYAPPPGAGRPDADAPPVGSTPAADAPGTGPGARPDPNIRTADGGRPPPSGGVDGGRPVASAAEDLIRRSADDTEIDEINDADASPSDRTLVTAGAPSHPLHANGADPVPRGRDADGLPSGGRRDDVDGPLRESRSPSTPDGERGTSISAGHGADDVQTSPHEHQSAGRSANAVEDSPSGSSATLDESSSRAVNGDNPVVLRDDSDLPPVDRDHGVLGVMDESRLTRNTSGLIAEIDGVPLLEHLTDLSLRRAEEFRAARATGSLTLAEVGKVTTVAVDTRTGSLAQGTNGAKLSRIEPSELHPLLAERYQAAHAERAFPAVNKDGSVDPDGRPFPAPYDPLEHAEVKAVNDLLWRRGEDAPSDALAEIRVANHYPFRGGGVKDAPCCASCAMILGDSVESGVGRFKGFPAGPHNFVDR